MSGPGWDQAIDNFLAYCSAEKGLAQASLEAAEHDLARLRSWCEGEGNCPDPGGVSDQDLRAFLLACATDLAASSRARLLSSIRSRAICVTPGGASPQGSQLLEGGACMNFGGHKSRKERSV